MSALYKPLVNHDHDDVASAAYALYLPPLLARPLHGTCLGSTILVPTPDAATIAATPHVCAAQVGRLPEPVYQQRPTQAFDGRCGGKWNVAETMETGGDSRNTEQGIISAQCADQCVPTISPGQLARMNHIACANATIGRATRSPQ